MLASSKKSCGRFWVEGALSWTCGSEGSRQIRTLSFSNFLTVSRNSSVGRTPGCKWNIAIRSAVLLFSCRIFAETNMFHRYPRYQDLLKSMEPRRKTKAKSECFSPESWGCNDDWEGDDKKVDVDGCIESMASKVSMVSVNDCIVLCVRAMYTKTITKAITNKIRRKNCLGDEIVVLADDSVLMAMITVWSGARLLPKQILWSNVVWDAFLRQFLVHR